MKIERLLTLINLEFELTENTKKIIANVDITSINEFISYMKDTNGD
jgi:hypothetical protein